MNIFIVIVHYGNIQTTVQCINTLQRNEKYLKKVVIVNNTLDAIKKYIPKDIVVINNKRNVGFAKGVNIGIQYSLQKKADAVCLLNNDTIIQQPFLKKLQHVIRNDPHIGIVGPAIEFEREKKKVFDIGGHINKIFLNTWHTEVSNITSMQSHDADYVSGCCMLIKKEVFEKIGFFDEHFFLYYEDVDFCLRAKEKDFGVVVVSSTVIQHALSAVVGKMSKIAIYSLTKSSIYFGKKYAKHGIVKYLNRLFILYQSFVFFVKSPYGIYAWKAIFAS